MGSHIRPTTGVTRRPHLALPWPDTRRAFSRRSHRGGRNATSSPCRYWPVWYIAFYKCRSVPDRNLGHNIATNQSSMEDYESANSGVQNRLRRRLEVVLGTIHWIDHIASSYMAQACWRTCRNRSTARLRSETAPPGGLKGTTRCRGDIWMATRLLRMRSRSEIGLSNSVKRVA